MTTVNEQDPNKSPTEFTGRKLKHLAAPNVAPSRLFFSCSLARVGKGRGVAYKASLQTAVGGIITSAKGGGTGGVGLFVAC